VVQLALNTHKKEKSNEIKQAQNVGRAKSIINRSSQSTETNLFRLPFLSFSSIGPALNPDFKKRERKLYFL
jgi:hypothetical protein